MLKGIKRFKGGYGFKNYEGQALPVMFTQPIPSQVIIPLRQGFSTEVKPLVKKGDAVFAGQIIGRDDDSISSPVHSSVNGVVEDIKRMNYFKRDISMMVIRTTDLSQEITPIHKPYPQWQKLSNEEIEKSIYLCGVASLDREGIPTRFKSSVISPDEVKHLIVHGVASEPYNISTELLLKDEKLTHFFEGVKILQKIMPKAKVHLGLNARNKKTIEQLVNFSADLDWLYIYPLEQKYPQGFDEILVSTILNQKFPYGYSAANIGVVVLNIQAVLGAYEAVVEGKPLVERTIALCGQSMKENLHLRVRIGTPLADLLANRLDESAPSRVVLNSLLSGVELNDFSLPVDKTFSQLIAIPENKTREFLAFLRPGATCDSYTRTFLGKFLPFLRKTQNTNQHGEERPCISCGFCEDVCPVRIIPHLLAKYVKREIIDEILVNYEIFNCIECGLCSFVCPSKIPLLAILKEGHEKLNMQGCDRSKCILPHFELTGIENYRGVTML